MPRSSTAVATYETAAPPGRLWSSNDVPARPLAARTRPPFEPALKTLNVTGCDVAGAVHDTCTVDPVTEALTALGAETAWTTSTWAVEVMPTTDPSAAVATARTWWSPAARPATEIELTAVHPVVLAVAGIVTSVCHDEPTSVSIRAATAAAAAPEAVTYSEELARVADDCDCVSASAPAGAAAPGAPAATTTGVDTIAGGSGRSSDEAVSDGAPAGPAPIARTR